jgi:hypothetical protein
MRGGRAIQKLAGKSFLIVGTYAWFESSFGEVSGDLFLACRSR